MIFHENRLLAADDSHEILYLIYFRKLGKMSQSVSSTAVVIGPLRVKCKVVNIFLFIQEGSFEHLQHMFWLGNRELKF